MNGLDAPLSVHPFLPTPFPCRSSATARPMGNPPGPSCSRPASVRSASSLRPWTRWPPFSPCTPLPPALPAWEGLAQAWHRGRGWEKVGGGAGCGAPAPPGPLSAGDSSSPRCGGCPEPAGEPRGQGWGGFCPAAQVQAEPRGGTTLCLAGCETSAAPRHPVASSMAGVALQTVAELLEGRKGPSPTQALSPPLQVLLDVLHVCQPCLCSADPAEDPQLASAVSILPLVSVVSSPPPAH